MNGKTEVLGWLVKTIRPILSIQCSGGHSLSGSRDLYEEIQFPVCPGCKIENSPVMQIDFRDKRLENLDLWHGVLVCMHCHNGCGIKDQHGWPNYWWDYSNPKAPIILESDQVVLMDRRPQRNWEFECVEVDIVPRIAKKTDKIDTETRIGGTPAWLQDPLQQGFDVLCIGCKKPMPMLFQWSETNMDYVPQGIRDTTGAIMGNPGTCYWFGCRECKIVGQIVEYG